MQILTGDGRKFRLMVSVFTSPPVLCRNAAILAAAVPVGISCSKSSLVTLRLFSVNATSGFFSSLAGDLRVERGESGSGVPYSEPLPVGVKNLSSSERSPCRYDGSRIGDLEPWKSRLGGSFLGGGIYAVDGAGSTS